MGTKKYWDRVVVTNPRSGKTDVWRKNSAGVTTKEGHRTFHRDTRVVTNHYGKKVGKY